MSDELARLFNAFDRGRISRRQLLQALGIAVAAAPVAALAQGAQGRRRGGRERAPLDTKPAKLPFKSTGWKTVLLDHITYEVDNASREAAYYNALMNWGVRSDTGKEAVLDIGDWGGMVIKAGYTAPPPTAEEKAQYARFQAQAKAHGQNLPPLTPVNAKFTNFAWGIEPWDAKAVEAALKERGLNPVAENHGKEFESFHVKDPDGFDVQVTNGNKNNRRRTPAHGKAMAPAPFPHTDWKTVWLDHISFEVPDYKQSVAFYEALLGWKSGEDTGNQNQVEAGDVGDLIIRSFNRPGAPPRKGVNIGHIAFGIQPFDPDQVKAELEKRGLPARVDTGNTGSDIHTAEYKSYHTKTPSGWDLQISATTKANRNAGAVATKPTKGPGL
ncbi:MAG TPA: VOC family protein [Vicinamibacterales bacterium]|jgi:catechol 2,3-dioxygenase-like lactoylglutathione lyase family enzyme